MSDGFEKAVDDKVGSKVWWKYMKKIVGRGREEANREYGEWKVGGKGQSRGKGGRGNRWRREPLEL